MTSTARIARPPLVARRWGYVLSILVNLVMLFAVNAWPTWRVIPILTEDTTMVIGLVNMSLSVGLLANVVYLAYDDAWVCALGGLVTSAIGLAVLARIWTVFPFALDAPSFPWSFVARFVLVVAIVGTAIGLLVHGVNLVRRVLTG